ncbi:MAG: PTS sugar transporter subunit IIC [Eubacteriales bacterium]
MSKNIRKEKRSIFEKISDYIMKLATPLAKFAQLKPIAAIQDGLVASMPVIIIGSLFLVIALLGTDQILGNGRILIPALTGLVQPLTSAFSMTLGFVGFYVAYTIAHSYAEKLGGLDLKQAGLIGLLSFFFLTFAGPTEGSISVQYFGSSGIFVAIISSLATIKVYKFFVDKNIVIKLPKSVPPNVGNAFTTLIPMLAIIVITWVIRTIIGFNLAEFLAVGLTPAIQAADSLGVYIFIMFITMLFWAIGLNGPAILGAITTPIMTTSVANNAAAKLAGEVLPNIWTQTFSFSYMWVASVWPILILLFLSKNKGNKAIGIASAPALVFNIIEPVMFGLPVAFNGFLMAPFVITGTLGTGIAYFLTSIGFIGRPFAEFPWATPPFLSGILSTGDWKVLIVQAFIFVLGLAIYLPFFKLYEKNEAIEINQEETTLN